MRCTLKSCKSRQIHTCEVQNSYMYKTCNSACSPCSFSLILHMDTLLQPHTERQDTALCLLVPCNLFPLRWPSPSPGWWWPILQHTHQYCCSQPVLWALHAQCVCVATYGGCSLRWQMPCSPSMAMGRDTGLNIETKSSPGHKSSNRLEMPCVHSPEADKSTWAGISPVPQRTRAVMHMLREDTSFWGRHQTVSVGLPDTRGHSNREVCWLGSWTLQEAPSEKPKVSVLVQKRNAQMLFPPSLTQLFPASTIVNAE